MPSPDTHAAIEWPTLMTVCREASRHSDIPLVLLSGTTRLDELTRDEVTLIEFISAVEGELRCDIPDLDVSTTLTLAQLATLAEKYRVKR